MSELLKLHLGCGSDRREGYLNVDIRDTPQSDLVFDLRKPWPWEDGSIGLIETKDLLPCLHPDQRVNFMNEAWRVLKMGGQLMVTVPGRGSNRSMMDPAYRWPPIVEDWFYFFSKEWRDAAGMSHYPIAANFHWSYGFVLDDEWVVKNDEAQRFAIKFYRNVTHSLQVTCTKLE